MGLGVFDILIPRKFLSRVRIMLYTEKAEIEVLRIVSKNHGAVEYINVTDRIWEIYPANMVEFLTAAGIRYDKVD